MAKLTKSVQDALNALAARGGTGVFDRGGVLLASGDRLGFNRATWNNLVKAGFIVIENKRATITEQGAGAVTDKTRHESQVAYSDQQWEG